MFRDDSQNARAQSHLQNPAASRNLGPICITTFSGPGLARDLGGG
jgi:hypothetical protein